MPVVEYSKEFITTVIVGKDVVPRIGLSQMESLRADLINAIKKSQKPKVSRKSIKIFIHTSIHTFYSQTVFLVSLYFSNSLTDMSKKN